MRLVVWISALAAVVAGVALFVLRPDPSSSRDRGTDGAHPTAAPGSEHARAELERDTAAPVTPQDRSSADPRGAEARVSAAKPEVAASPVVIATSLPVDVSAGVDGSGGGAKGATDFKQKYAGMSHEQIVRAFDDLDAVINDPAFGERYDSAAMGELKREHEYLMTLRDN